MNDWLLTSFSALIVTDRDVSNWEGVPEIVPVDELRTRPEGRDPDTTENIAPSPLIRGVTENTCPWAMIYSDCEYENDVIGLRMVNVRENVLLFTLFSAWTVIVWDVTVWVGIPDMTPVEVWIDRPEGRDPDTIVNTTLLLSILGTIETDWPRRKT